METETKVVETKRKSLIGQAASIAKRAFTPQQGEAATSVEANPGAEVEIDTTKLRYIGKNQKWIALALWFPTWVASFIVCVFGMMVLNYSIIAGLLVVVFGMFMLLYSLYYRIYIRLKPNLWVLDTGSHEFELAHYQDPPADIKAMSMINFESNWVYPIKIKGNKAKEFQKPDKLGKDSPGALAECLNWKKDISFLAGDASLMEKIQIGMMLLAIVGIIFVAYLASQG